MLVQPHVPGPWRGVLFADDAGRRLAGAPARRRRRPSAIDGEWIAELDHPGRVRDVAVGRRPASVRRPHLLARVARVAEKVAGAFDGPHDIEWVIADDGRVQLLRVRPVVRLHVDAGGRNDVPAPRRELVATAA